MLRRICIRLLVTLAIAFTAFQSRAQGRIVNRSILTINRDGYTALDAYVLLAAWKYVNNDFSKMSFDFLQNPEISIDVQKPVLESIKNLPPDVQSLLFVTFVWNEIKRLNLFEVSQKEITTQGQNFLKKGNVYGLRDEVWEFVRKLSEENLKNYVEIALRARTYKKVRGDLSSNPALATTSWTWHAAKAATNNEHE